MLYVNGLAYYLWGSIVIIGYHRLRVVAVHGSYLPGLFPLEWSPGPCADCAASADRLFGHLSHVDVGRAITMFCFLTEENPLYAGLVLVELHDA